ncbi:DUF2922 domain-containing protein [Enterococcus hulanensis]|uniref:DUF2922 domain-containing protein n=1 Tax=Enterococcus hulanensis TaxID=2559929 RepID=A0ABU3F6W4_9ENTE|nr:DUF2922 domain-containing protein [Enterococcus hulanensis]MDT2602283.1 DUF2922 domain-containing protein [Enterococcus hulanensis]MDT2611678.1 DUF2922 domain-containing protein [Enterococcus hulanensis]MDT2618924.1 DUF2922 domain-containing protein [Enterococcus hulanensis]MDT2630355.1 DUF2922 domain-containing protein [Enterococcus hulanensis]MDT2657841.1 DUF2922 domain-containing protein [Enterococcus hulanensis]
MYAAKTIQTKKLVSTFYKSNGKKHNLTVKNPTVEKSAEEIREALELLTTLDIFEEEDGVKTFAEVDTCKYVETTKYIQFDPEHPVEAVELPAAPKSIEVPVTNYSKPKYDKFIDLACPPVLEKLKFEAPELAPITNSELTNDLSESKMESNAEEPPLSQEPSQSPNKHGGILKRKLSRIWGRKGKNKEDSS